MRREVGFRSRDVLDPQLSAGSLLSRIFQGVYSYYNPQATEPKKSMLSAGVGHQEGWNSDKVDSREEVPVNMAQARDAKP